jgi:hypothetical protein
VSFIVSNGKKEINREEIPETFSKKGGSICIMPLDRKYLITSFGKLN